jgi:hypothetical protein
LSGSSSSTTKSSTTTKAATTTTSSCATATSVAVTFNEKVTTTYGQTVKISGNIAALGNWATGSAVALSASQYTTANPLWFVTLNLAPGTVVQYKYTKVDSSGAVTWEADPNHTLTVAASCATATAVTSTWQ